MDIDSDGSDQRKTFDTTDSQMDETPPVTNPEESPLETSNNDAQALNLTTSTSTSNVYWKIGYSDDLWNEARY